MTARLLLQLTDCHLLDDPAARLLGVDTQATFAAVLDQALAEATPDLLLLTGDLAHTPTEATYRRLRTLVRDRYRGALAVLPGNHDALAPLTAVFPECPGAAQEVLPLSWAGMRVLLCDSHNDDQAGGEFTDACRAELERQVANSDEPVLLVLHHPLLPVDAPWLDKDCVPGGEALLRSLAAVGPLRAVLFGHVHQPVTQHYAGVTLHGTPSTCFQFPPRSQRFSITQEQPGYRWLRWASDGTLGTTLRRLQTPRISVEPRFLAAENG